MAEIPSKPAKRKLVVLEDNLLRTMANSGTFLKEFPFVSGLAVLPKAKKGCGGCAQQARERAGVFNAAKRLFASLGGDKKRVLRDLLNADRVRIAYRSESGKQIVLTF